MELTEREIIRIDETVSMIPEGIDSILEVGCGDGRLFESFNQQFNLCGIDIDKDKVRSFPGNKVIANVSRLPVRDDEFDLVLSGEVLEHLNNETFTSAIREISRVAKHYILITVPFKEALPANWKKCSKCGNIFHAWGHIRKFDSEMCESLFVNAYLLKRSFLSPKEARIPSKMYVIAKKAGKVWGSKQEKDVLCPRCGHPALKSKGNFLGKLFIRIIGRMDKMKLSEKPIWICCLYKKIC